MNARNGRRPLTTLRVAGLALVLVLSGAIAAAQPVGARTAVQATAQAPAAVPQMHDLDPLLGKWRCDETAPPPGEQATQLYLNARRSGVNGYYDTVEAVLQPGDLHGMTVWAWDSVDGTFIAQYHDDWGSSSATTSPGWKDGHLVFSGPLIQAVGPSTTGHVAGAHLDLQDDYALIRPGYFKAVTTVTVPGGPSFAHTYDCLLR